ncbi:hypothetical protein JMF89_06045 [Clostridiaceae bacterium UIB06]|uniref:Uncharacterized protein n=1 Tax=Clostridium thailandense TaxID=2794346 RepID=A0A949U0T7_9CLOT|nr:hypothetical protein [Clostridium thailandense]MBV7274363.1 hypothetical protein [Clostridium thailandense]MCH5136762.1 hypothetical protein [Clostridiaceae bacterium UIB06]
MKYIGPFLRINKLKKENVEHQLFYLAKESLKQIVLYSKCGIHTSLKDLKTKNIPNFDINTFKDVSPLLCVYKKASTKLINIDNNLCWDEDKFKREINIDSNSLMTLCLLELHDYYSRFRNIDTNKYNLAKLYLLLCKKQLEFYASYFRNDEGVFVDKKDLSDSFTGELTFEEKNKKFKFSSQALFMAAYYKCSCLCKNDDKENYKNFSLDILNMFLEFKEELYLLDSEELTELCLGLNIFYKYSQNQDCKVLLLDLSELLYEKVNDEFYSPSDFQLEQDCKNYINFILLYKNTGIIKFKDKSDIIFNNLLELYNPEKGIFIKNTESKDITFSCLEIALYVITCLMDSHINACENKSDLIILDVFKRQLVDSGIIPSWPETPELQDVERYINYTLKSEDLIDEQDFRMPSIPTPENCELAAIFYKNITYNKKKETFKVSKTSFDTNKNMMIFFLVIHLLKPKKTLPKIIEENLDSDEEY